MDSDISPIFDQAVSTSGAPTDSPAPEATPLNEVVHQDEYMEQPPYPPHQQYMYHQPAPPASSPAPHWDPFSTIGITSWVVIGIIFIIGFIVGKLR